MITVNNREIYLNSSLIGFVVFNPTNFKYRIVALNKNIDQTDVSWEDIPHYVESKLIDDQLIIERPYFSAEENPLPF